MGWSYRIVEVTKPGLDTIRVTFDVTKDGTLIQRDDVSFLAGEIAFSEQEAQKAAIHNKIIDRIKLLSSAEQTYSDLSYLVGLEVPLSGDKAVIAKELLSPQYQGLDSEQVLALLNERSVPSDPPAVELWEVKQTLIETGEWWGIVEGQSISDPIELGYACKAAVEFINDLRNDVIWLNLPSVQAFLGALQTAGIISENTITTIQGMSNTSRARQLLGRDAVAGDLL